MTRRATREARKSFLSRNGSLGRVPPSVWGLALLALLTLMFTTTESSYVVFIFNTVLLACMGAMALQLLQGTAGLLSVGSAAFLLIGSFGAVALLRAGVPFPLDIVGASVLAGLAGLTAGIPALRLRALYLGLATLSVHFIAIFLGNLYQSSVPSVQAEGFFVPTLFGSKGVNTSTHYWAWLLFGLVAIEVIVVGRLMRERSGRALRMMRDHEFIAPAFGISVPRYKLTVFILSSAVFGVEGALLAHLTGNIVTENFPLLLAFQFVVMILVGGLDSILGAIIGAAIVVALPAWTPNVMGVLIGHARARMYGPDVAEIIYGVLVIVFVTSSPGGVVGILRAVKARALRGWSDGERAGAGALAIPSARVPSGTARSEDVTPSGVQGN
jgi:branched-chain amino acid transport system permease protein